MKTLVVYYSRSGTTKKVAELIAQKLNADTEELIDQKDRSGPLGYLIAGKDATQKNLTTLQPTKNKPENYDLVIVGTPIWAWTVCPATRTYLTENKGKIKKTAFFCTQGGSGSERAFSEMEKTLEIAPLSTFACTTKEAIKEDISPKLETFYLKLR